MILPPLANHYSKGAGDFRKRIEQISSEDLKYLLALIMNGSESLGCVPPSYINILLETIASKIGAKSADTVRKRYEEDHECPT